MSWTPILERHFEREARIRIGAAVEQWVGSPEGQRHMSMRACDDGPSWKRLPHNVVTPQRLRTAILHGLTEQPDESTFLCTDDLELARLKLSVTWNEVTCSFDIGWVGE